MHSHVNAGHSREKLLTTQVMQGGLLLWIGPKWRERQAQSGRNLDASKIRSQCCRAHAASNF